MHVLLYSLPPILQHTTLIYASAQDSWTLPVKSGSVSFGVTSSFPGSWCTQGSVCALQEPISQSCVSSGSPMVGLVATSSKRAYAIPKSAASSPTQVCCTQSPCLCSSLLLTCICTGDTQTLFCFHLCGVFGSWCTQSLLEKVLEKA